MIWDLTQQKPVHLVLDNTVIETQLISILEKYTGNIKSFNSTDEFLSEPLSEAPACLITELELPDTDGITLIKRLREHGLSMPVIIVASIDDGVYSAVKAFQAGAVDFIELPIVERDFIERVNMVIKQSTE